MCLSTSSQRFPNRPLSLALAGLLWTPVLALAGPADKVYTPHSVAGETEIEFRYGYEDADHGPNPSQAVLDFGYGVSDRWFTELVLKYEDAAPGGDGQLADIEWENILVLTEPGRYWLNVGLFNEVEYARESKDWEIVLGPMFEKQLGREQFNVNLLFEQKLKDRADTELVYRAQWKHRAGRQLEYGVQAFGELGAVKHLGREEEHKVGPALFGSFPAGGNNKWVWDTAVLIGVDRSAPDLSFRFELEYEAY